MPESRYLRQPQAHVQIVVSLLDFAINVQEAGDAARVVHASDSQPRGGRMTNGGVVYVEAGTPEVVVEELQRRGHTVTHGERRYVGSYGAYQANFPIKQIGPLMSECLVTGFHDEGGAVVLCTPDTDVPFGTRLA